MKESRLRKTIGGVSVLAVLVFVTYYLIMRDKDLGSVWQVVVNSSKIWLVVSSAAMAVYVFCGGWAIKVLMKGRGKKVTILQCFKYSFIEFYFSALTPSSTGGQPAQFYYMEKDGLPASDSTVVLVAITVLYKGAFLVITAILFLLNTSYIAGPAERVWVLAVLGLLLNVGLITLLLLLLFSKNLINVIVRFFIRILARLHIVKNVVEKTEHYEKKLANYHKCASFFMKHKLVVLRAAGVLALQRLMLLFVPYLVYKSFGLSGYTMLQILATQALLNLCVDMMPLPGAVGISETVFLMLFTPIFTEAGITTAVLLSRGISFYLLLMVSGIVVIGIQIFGIVKGNKSQKTETVKNE